MGRIKKLNILILNWRDVRTPGSGGAEIQTLAMAKIWKKLGHSVLQISAGFKGLKKTETIDGIKIIRLGSWWTVHVFAFFYYIINLRNKIDVIVDEVHGIPFFARIYAPKKTILFACEVADDLFFKVYPYPLALFGIFLERVYFFLYKNIRVVTISESTKKDLIKRGFNKKNITIMPMGLSIPKAAKKTKKEKNPTLIYLSRINKQKGIEDAIKAFSLIHKKVNNSYFWVVGSGEPEYVRKNKKRIDSKLRPYVKFFGFVDDNQKFNLLSRAQILIFPTIHEGWGLVIAEAGVVGTPSAVYDVPGVRDVVKNGEMGIMVPVGRYDLLAERVIKILKNAKLYNDLLKKIKPFENKIGWEKTAKVVLSEIEKV